MAATGWAAVAWPSAVIHDAPPLDLLRRLQRLPIIVSLAALARDGRTLPLLRAIVLGGAVSVALGLLAGRYPWLEALASKQPVKPDSGRSP